MGQGLFTSGPDTSQRIHLEDTSLLLSFLPASLKHGFVKAPLASCLSIAWEPCSYTLQSSFGYLDILPAVTTVNPAVSLKLHDLLAETDTMQWDN